MDKEFPQKRSAHNHIFKCACSLVIKLNSCHVLCAAFLKCECPELTRLRENGQLVDIDTKVLGSNRKSGSIYRA